MLYRQKNRPYISGIAYEPSVEKNGYDSAKMYGFTDNAELMPPYWRDDPIKKLKRPYRL